MPYRYNAITGEFDVVLDGSSGAVIEIDADTGTVIPVAGVVNAFGAGGITTSGSGNTLTIDGGDLAYIGPYIVGDDPRVDYATIQEAIDAADADGSTGSNILNIYIKPGTYTEDLVFPSNIGLNLIAFSNTQASYVTQVVVPDCSVRIVGNHTFSSGRVAFIGTRFQWVSGAPFSFSTSFTLTLYNCAINQNSAGGLIEIDNSTDSTIDLYYYNSSIQISNGNYITFTTSGQNTAIRNWVTNSFWSPGVSLTMPSGGTITCDLNARDSILDLPEWDLTNVDSSTTNLYNCRITDATAGTSLITIGASVSGGIYAQGCTLDIENYTNIIDSSANSSYVINFDTCNLGNPRYVSARIISIVGGEQYIMNCSSQFNSGQNSSPSERLFTLGSTAIGADNWKSQATVTTTDATVTNLLSLTLSGNETIVVKGTIIGTQDDFSESCGGDFLIVARRAAGAAAIVGSPVINVQSDTTATFTADVSGTVRIRVTGVAAETWDWVCTYEFQKNLGA